MNARFTIDGSDALEDRLAQTCHKVLDGVRAVVPENVFEALVLGGGYGRGQGGVLRTESDDQPYNDLEFYVFTRGNILWNERRFCRALSELGERLSPGAGLHVEFKVYSREKLRRSPVTMFTYDLVAGHKTIFGDETVFHGCEHHLAADRIPLHEATRLMFNRCSGLLLAKNFLRNNTLSLEQIDFIGRNLAKAQLAFGDTVLVVAGQYHWDSRERHARLELLSLQPAPSWLPQVRKFHETGVEFKIHPRRTQAGRDELQRHHSIVTDLGREVWLWLERRRLNQPFLTVRDYAEAAVVKCPESVAWRNCLLNLKTFGVRGLLNPRCGRYPRERLFNALSLLLWDDNATKDPATRSRIRKDLHAAGTDWPDLISAYERVWQNYG